MAELKIANKLVYQLNEKIDSQDSIIVLYTEKEKSHQKQIADYEKTIEKKDKIITGLEKDVNDLTRKNTNLKSGLKWLGGGFVASLLTIVTFIVVK